MKKIRTLLFALLLIPFAFLLSACFGGKGNSGSNSNSSPFLNTTEINEIINNISSKFTNVSLEVKSIENGVADTSYYFFQGTGENEIVLIKQTIEVFGDEDSEFVPIDRYIGKISDNFYIVTNTKTLWRAMKS